MTPAGRSATWPGRALSCSATSGPSASSRSTPPTHSVEPDESHRPAIFLTNALTGWDGPEQLKLQFPEL